MLRGCRDNGKLEKIQKFESDGRGRSFVDRLPASVGVHLLTFHTHTRAHTHVRCPHLRFYFHFRFLTSDNWRAS